MPVLSYEEELERVLASRAFAKAHRQARLLRYLVEQTASGAGDRLKESIVAVEVFDRDATYDPKIDSVVRVEAAKLRARLDSYYAEEGKNAPIRISIPKGSYRAEFAQRADEPGPAPERRKRIYVTVAAAVLAATLGLIWAVASRPQAPQPVAAPQPSIAVLPFLDLSAEHSSARLAAGLTDDLTNAVANAQGVHVISRSSAAQFPTGSTDVRRLKAELGVHAVVEGSIRRAGNRVRVTAQFVETANGLQLWNRSFEADINDALEAQRSLANLIGKHFRHALTGVRRAIVRPHTQAEAYKHYLQAVNIATEDEPGATHEAIRALRLSVAADPNYAMAWAGLGRLHVSLAEQEAEPVASACRDAEGPQERAFTLDASLVESRVTRALYRMICHWDWDGAEQDLRQAIELDPAFLLPAHEYGRLLIVTGRLDEAARVYQAALKADPRWNWLLNGLASSLIKAGRYEEARKPLEESAQVHRSPGYLMYRGMLDAEAGRHADALPFFEQALKVAPGSPSLNGRYAYSLAKLGRTDEAARVLEKLLHPMSGNVSEYEIACVYAGLGEPERAFESLNKALSKRSPAAIFAKVDYRLRPLQSRREYRDAIARLNLT